MFHFTWLPCSIFGIQCIRMLNRAVIWMVWLPKCPRHVAQTTADRAICRCLAAQICTVLSSQWHRHFWATLIVYCYRSFNITHNYYWQNAMGVKFGVEESTTSMPNFTPIGTGVGATGPKNWKFYAVSEIIAPQQTLHDFYKIFMVCGKFLRGLTITFWGIHFRGSGRMRTIHMPVFILL